MNIKLDAIAKVICNNYELKYIENVGGGTFKETYHVHNKNGLSEALKVFRQGHSSRRSEREIDAMIKCDHPNIGKLKHVDKIGFGGETYLFTIEEYLPGGTLTKRLRKGLLSFEETINFSKQLISAVGHIAKHNLVHRDIKPDNIMFRKDGKTPVIVDFGLVRNLMDQSLTQTWLMQGPGSPFFAAPEQLNNQKELIDWRTDQFALGILISLCFFGVHPYSQTDDNPGDVVSRVSQREPLNESFSTKTKESGLNMILKMVAQWPVQRYRTPRELAEAWSNAVHRRIGHGIISSDGTSL